MKNYGSFIISSAGVISTRWTPEIRTVLRWPGSSISWPGIPISTIWLLLSLARMMNMNGRLDSFVEMIGRSQGPNRQADHFHYQLPLSGGIAGGQGSRTTKFQEKGIPTFPSIERGAVALKNAFDYYRMRDSLSSE